VRELKDPASTRLREGDALFAVLAGTTRDRLALFSTSGGLYVLKVNDVPATTGYGEPIQSLLKFGDGERVAAAFLLSAEPDAANGDRNGEGEGAQRELFLRGARGASGAARQDGQKAARQDGAAADAAGSAGAAYLLATARGYGFRCAPDLSETTRAGRRVARVGGGDEVVCVVPVMGAEAICATAKGKMLRFPVDEAAELSGPGRGVILMRLDADDRLVGAVCPRAGQGFVAVTPDGAERSIPAGDVPAGRRAGKGQKVVKRGGVAALRMAQ
jgi:DNA gyrase subunit A